MPEIPLRHNRQDAMLDTTSISQALANYAVVKRAIAFVSSRPRERPSIDGVAENVGLTPMRLEQVLERWAGLTTTAFLQAVSVEHVRELLRNSAATLEEIDPVGLSGPARPRDVFTTYEALTPGDRRRENLVLRYGFHPSPFGEAVVVMGLEGLAGLGFVDDDGKAALGDMRRRWRFARFLADADATGAAARRAFDTKLWRPDAPLRLTLIGSDFDVLVWKTLLRAPVGSATSYSDIARTIGKPSAARAVGAAVGRNPISFVVPCHRALGRSGALTGYYWGLGRKQAMIAWEAGRAL
jgi:AraC family transcriptional regulator, regulatory protein of adaptative response / methylated-DNA-[protein]-cysteine methyltransferase